MNPIQEDILMHYGVKRRSGRYPWGSGENPFQHGGDFLSRVEELKSQGKSEKEIADELKMSTTDLRMQVRVEELRSLRSQMADMTERMERMQVVLDTGTLVGELADPMDSALGQRQAYKGRGI